MPVIPNRHEFEPNSNALQLWLHTRKNRVGSAIVTRPGLFSTQGFPTDQVWFLIAVFLEIVGISLLIYGGLSKGGPKYAILAILVPVVLFFFDLVLAYLLHRNEGDKVAARNALLLEEDGPRRMQYKDTLKKGTLVNLLLILGMILIGLVKLIGIVFLGSGLDHIGTIIILALMFAIIIFVHIRFTGYYLYEKFTERAFKRQFNLYNYGDTDAQGLRIGQARERNSQFTYSSPDLLGQGRDRLEGNNSSIISRAGENDDGSWQYEITTKGILTDGDVSAFLAKPGLNNDQISKIAAACLQHQLFILSENT